MTETLALPVPGTWRPTQTLAGKVIQWAFTCQRCQKTTLVLESPPKAIGQGKRLEAICHCSPKKAKKTKAQKRADATRNIFVPEPAPEKKESTEDKKPSPLPRLYDERDKGLWPSVCSICGKSDRAEFDKTGRHIAFYAPQVCLPCFKKKARTK